MKFFIMESSPASYHFLLYILLSAWNNSLI